jgi:hypothetical protein
VSHSSTFNTPQAGRNFITIMMWLFLGLLGFHAIQEIYTNYECNRDLLSYWKLSAKASTLKQKSLYLDEFVANLEAAHLSGNNALILKTPDNSYEQNMATLKSLQSRMEEIKSMDVKSFEYQQAMYQISAQEEGGVNGVGDLIGVWYLDHHSSVWGWIDVVRWILEVLFAIVFMTAKVGPLPKKPLPALMVVAVVFGLAAAAVTYTLVSR